MTRIPGLPAVVALACFTAACSLLPAQMPPPQMHDFGPLPAIAHATASSVRSDTVMASVWLASDSIHYRLLYDDPTALRDYADHRWAAPPAQLLAARLQYLLPQASTDSSSAHAGYTLSATLLEFEQDFSTPKDARVLLDLEVSLRRPGDGQIIAQKRFALSQSTAPDVRGAISGLAELADNASLAIATWANGQSH